MLIDLNNDIDAEFARYEGTNEKTEERWITDPVPWTELEELLNSDKSPGQGSPA
ncbi:MAG TPA: hypothetical protein VMU64_07010 [Acidimicrobiales bacterium]|nr:hypothetical protein [Acidimicrobiales bacterium]